MGIYKYKGEIMEFVKTKEGKNNCIDYPMSYFIIPFSFETDQYNDMEKCLIKDKWIQHNELNSNEFFLHIRQLIKDDSENSICNRYYKRVKDISIVEKDSDSSFATINSIELYIFRTGIGFYKYSVCYHRSVDVDELISLNNKIKSISHVYHDIIVEEEVSIEFHHKMKTESDVSDGYIKAIDYTDGKKTIMIHHKFLEELVEDREIKVTFGREKKKFIRYIHSRRIDIRDFLNEELCEIKTITYFNKHLYENKTKQMASKANVFVVGLLHMNEYDDNIIGIKTFLLSRAYKGSYKKTLVDKKNEDIFSTFDNSIWSVAREGVANLVWQVGDNETDTFFKSTYFDRVDNYFFLYILALHQYYSLIKAAQDISKLPYSFNDYSDNNENYDRLMKMYDEVNYIYLRCIYHEVTHISHQAVFYQKLYDMLGIESLLNEINFEMDRLTSIVSQIRDNKRRESYQLQEEGFRTRQEQRTEDENRRRIDAEKKSNREKRYAIIGSIFAFFTVFEALWSIAISAEVTKIVTLNVNEKVIYVGFILSLIIIAFVIGTVVYSIWNKLNNKEVDVKGEE